jgi:hypothetical protein
MTASRRNVKHQFGTVNPIIQREEEIIIATVDKAFAASGNAQIIGRNGELPLLEFFNRHLPYTIRAHTGHFVAPDGTLSPQLDVVLVDARYPLLAQHMDGSVLVMLHSVLMTIEVKTRATSADVTKAFDNARIIHELASQIELREENKFKFEIGTDLFCYRLRYRLSNIHRQHADVKNIPLTTYVLRVPDADRPAGVTVGAVLYVSPLDPPDFELAHNPLSDLYYESVFEAYLFLGERDFSLRDIWRNLDKYMTTSTLWHR